MTKRLTAQGSMHKGFSMFELIMIIAVTALLFVYTLLPWASKVLADAERVQFNETTKNLMQTGAYWFNGYCRTAVETHVEWHRVEVVTREVARKGFGLTEAHIAKNRPGNEDIKAAMDSWLGLDNTAPTYGGLPSQIPVQTFHTNTLIGYEGAAFWNSGFYAINVPDINIIKSANEAGWMDLAKKNITTLVPDDASYSNIYATSAGGNSTIYDGKMGLYLLMTDFFVESKNLYPSFATTDEEKAAIWYAHQDIPLMRLGGMHLAGSTLLPDEFNNWEQAESMGFLLTTETREYLAQFTNKGLYDGAGAPGLSNRGRLYESTVPVSLKYVALAGGITDNPLTDMSHGTRIINGKYATPNALVAREYFDTDAKYASIHGNVCAAL